jgi:hypothetical protein
VFLEYLFGARVALAMGIVKHHRVAYEKCISLVPKNNGHEWMCPFKTKQEQEVLDTLKEGRPAFLLMIQRKIETRLPL